MQRDDLTAKQLDSRGRSQYALFLPALSSFYGTFVGKQRVMNYVDPSRYPPGMTDMEQLNYLNPNQGITPYKWSLYSAGHADLDLNKKVPAELMVRDRDPNSFLLGDSGGFQIGKGVWAADWRAGSGCAQAQKYRDSVLTWLDNTMDYAMILDIPTWVVKDPVASSAISIKTYEEAVAATKFNNEYFIKHRRGRDQGGAKFLNVLQGANHSEADQWYDIVKGYCDPTRYPGRHFDGWSMGGQNMCDMHLVLRRLVALKYDGLLQQGVHDWMHFLGTGKLEWALLLTVLQTALRDRVNPDLTISFDCASPFLAVAKGQIYHKLDMPLNDNWSYRMTAGIDDKKYALDNRNFADVAELDFPDKFSGFTRSPISDICRIRDICVYKQGVPRGDVSEAEFDPTNPEHYDVIPDLNKIGKFGKTSWDSFSYMLQMAHNVWLHIYSVQEANRQFAGGHSPSMLQWQGGDWSKFQDIVDKIFSAKTRAEAEAIIERYDSYWMQIIGTRGAKGKKTKNSMTMFNTLFEE